jgi:hypothetical protein
MYNHHRRCPPQSIHLQGQFGKRRRYNELARFDNGKWAKPILEMANSRNPIRRVVKSQISTPFLPACQVYESFALNTVYSTSSNYSDQGDKYQPLVGLNCFEGANF